jgi:hypothetical protein
MNQFVPYEYACGYWHIYQYSHQLHGQSIYQTFTEEGGHMPIIYITKKACLDRAQQLNKERAQ